jgi:hypothetical protein
LSETLTTDLLRPIQKWAFPKSANVRLKFVIDTESDNVQEKLSAIGKAWEIGLKIKADELYQIVGTARPDGEDEILANPKIHPPGGGQFGQAIPGMPGLPPPGSPAVISPESFLDSVMAHYTKSNPSLAV